MNHLAIVRILSILGVWLSGILLVCAIIAYGLGEPASTISFVIAAILCGPLGATVLLLTDKPVQKTRPKDGLAVAVLFWFIMPVFCAIPFLPMTNGGGFMVAYYESVSCLTTTGHSLLALDENPLPASLLLWRAVLHVFGTIAAITIAASVLAALNLGGPGIHKSYYFTIPEGSFFDSIPRIIRGVSLIMVVIMIVLGSVLLFIGVPAREAISGAVSAVSTGLVDPGAAAYAPSRGGLHAAIIGLGLVLGTIGLVVLDNLARGKFGRAAKDPETITFFGLILLVGLFAFMAGLPAIPGFGWALSSLSTSGIALTDPDRFSRVPLVLILFPVLIGGSALSAAGGIKLARLIVLSKRVILEFSQLGYRGSVQTFTFRGRKQSERTVMGVWVYLVGYLIACISGILILSLLGLSFDDAIRTAIGALSNAGHLIEGGAVTQAWPVQICVILGMVLGRLEVIALLPVLSRSFWSR